MKSFARSLALLIVLLAAPANAEPVRVAVFDFELIDTSLEGSVAGPRDDEAARLARLGDQLRAAVGTADGFALVDVAPVADAVHRVRLSGCNGCDGRFARELGADWAITGTVQKVSNLILNINVYVRDAGTGALTQTMSADIRGNTDTSWERGMAWLIRNRLRLQP